jgi:hypothetical protein
MYPVESVHKQARLSHLVINQLHFGSPEPGSGGCAEEEVLVFHKMRNFGRIQLQDVAR